MTRVLFICTHNSARSQMAEAWLNLLGGGDFVAESAGLEPGTLNPYVVKAMREQGVDISGAATRSVFETFKKGALFNCIITVCADAESKCPIYPGIAQRMHVPFPDPSSFTGTPGEILAQVRVVRDAIKAFVLQFVLNTHKTDQEDTPVDPVECRAKAYMVRNTSKRG